WSSTWGSSGCRASRSRTEVSNANRIRQGEDHGGPPVRVPPSVRTGAVRPPTRHPAVPAGGHAGPRRDVHPGRHDVLPVGLRDAVPGTRARPATFRADRPGLVSPVLLGPPEGRGQLPL